MMSSGYGSLTHAPTATRSYGTSLSPTCKHGTDSAGNARIQHHLATSWTSQSPLNKGNWSLPSTKKSRTCTCTFRHTPRIQKATIPGWSMAKYCVFADFALRSRMPTTRYHNLPKDFKLGATPLQPLPPYLQRPKPMHEPTWNALQPNMRSLGPKRSRCLNAKCTSTSHITRKTLQPVLYKSYGGIMSPTHRVNHLSPKCLTMTVRR